MHPILTQILSKGVGQFRVREQVVVRVTLRRLISGHFDGRMVNLRKVLTTRSQTRQFMTLTVPASNLQ